MLSLLTFVALSTTLVSSQDECSLCPNGETTPTPDLVVSVKTGITCSQIEQKAKTIDDSTSCKAYTQDTGYATMCRCYADESTCTLCVDGSLPMKNDIKGECHELFLDVPFLKKDSRACMNMQRMGFAECGCPTAPSPELEGCTLCADGSYPNGDLSTRIFGKGDKTTCKDLLNSPLLATKGSLQCKNIQKLGETMCGCRPTRGDFCSACEGTLPEPDRILREGVTCRDLNSMVSSHSLACPKIQAEAYLSCDCPTLPELPQGEPCTLCSSGESYDGEAIFGDPDDGLKCIDTAIDIFAAASSESCARSQALAYLYCGCNSLPKAVTAYPPCTLCPLGAPPSNPELILSDVGGLTCEEMDILIPLVVDKKVCDVQPHTKLCCSQLHGGAMSGFLEVRLKGVLSLAAVFSLSLALLC